MLKSTLSPSEAARHVPGACQLLLRAMSAAEAVGAPGGLRNLAVRTKKHELLLSCSERFSPSAGYGRKDAENAHSCRATHARLMLIPVCCSVHTHSLRISRFGLLVLQDPSLVIDTKVGVRDLIAKLRKLGCEIPPAADRAWLLEILEGEMMRRGL